ncbi:MAG: DUF1080 domain-containing protein [Verrucomicrobia bacterium]|nr:DUF1080 domain-containing protein [Verrucomicrobiota bacterium]MBI3867003.1 DUF1080 domain-containing protein [Verrucomicrobiota bacterium]
MTRAIAGREALAIRCFILVLAFLPPWIAAAASSERAATWTSLFNGRDLAGWDVWLGPKSGGYHDPKTSKESPLGLNNDPLHVFSVDREAGVPAIHVSGQVFGAITTREEFENFHLRIEYKWGTKKWPPRNEPQHYPDSGALYWAIGPQGAGSYAWMRSVECNIMQKGVGQWWAVDGTYVDVEARKVVLEKEPWIPYRGEGPGEECHVYQKGLPLITTGGGITSGIDPEKPGEWNVCEVIAWGNVGLHLLNGQVSLALVNPRYTDNNIERPLNHGKIQLQSEGAEIFFRKVELRPISKIPSDLLTHVPLSSPSEEGFASLIGRDEKDGWAQCGPGNFTVADGVATGHGGMGLWWHTRRAYTNFVIRGEWLQEQPIADSGLFVRFPDPGQDPWKAVREGHEMEIGDPHPAKPSDTTGSIYPFSPPVEVPVKPPGKWNAYELVCVGHNYSVRLNGQLVNTWTDPQKRSLAGYVGIQNYNDGKTVRHRNLRIKPLP